MPRYCLDANVLIEAKNGPYGFDIVPGFWDWIDCMVDTSVIYSVRAVYDEITLGDDVLTSWVKDRRQSGLFVEPSDAVKERLRMIADYVVNSFEPQHAQSFLSWADPWVIAQASVDQAVVVTREVLAGPGSERAKIPNVFIHFSVGYTDTYAMLRSEGAASSSFDSGNPT